MDLQEAIQVVESALERPLKDVEMVIFKGSWEGLTYDEMIEGTKLTANYLKGDVGHKFWLELSKALGEPVSKRNFRVAVERKGENTVISQSSGDISRPHLESFCRQEISKPGSLLRIKAAPKMGKTTFISHLIRDAEEKEGVKAILLPLKLAETADLENIDSFLYWFVTTVTLLCDIETSFNKHEWENLLGSSKVKAMRYLEKLLKEKPLSDKEYLVLGIDDLDSIYHKSEVADDFLTLLRVLHEQAKSTPILQKLRLILSYSKDYELPIHVSPFNVGSIINLPPFEQEEAKQLATKYQITPTDDELEELLKQLGGNPHLLKIAFTNMAAGMTFKEILQESDIYSEYLRSLWHNLEQIGKDKHLEEINKILNSDLSVRLDNDAVFKLEEIGLVKRENAEVVLFCPLYKQYFQTRLKELP